MRRFLLTGLTGVGKSSFVNATFGVQLAKTDAFETCTRVVEAYADSTPWGRVCLVDTPGMEAELIDVDDRYLSLVRDYLRNSPCDALLYFSRLNETRFRPDERRAIDRLVTGLGPAPWSHTWLILSFAAAVPSDRVDEQCRHRSQDIHDHFASLLRKTGHSFHFQKVLLVDNVVPRWSADTVPISRLLLT